MLPPELEPVSPMLFDWYLVAGELGLLLLGL